MSKLSTPETQYEIKSGTHRESQRCEKYQFNEPKQADQSKLIYITEFSPNQISPDFQSFIKSKSTRESRPFIQGEEENNLKFLFFKNRCESNSLSSLIDSFSKHYNYNNDEILNELKDQILKGIQSMGFKNTKINSEKTRTSFLYAINDNCNNLNPKVSTFPMLMLTSSKFIEIKIIFAVECKPGLFIDQASLKSVSLDSLFQLDGNHKNIESLLPSSSKFSNFHKMKNPIIEFGKFYYLKLVLYLLKRVNKYLNAWKFIFDYQKNQIYCRLMTRPLYPLSLNKKLPQTLTSEGIICFTSVAHALYIIYEMKQKNEVIEQKKLGEWMKNMIKDIKTKLKKPVLPFSLEENSSKKLVYIKTEDDKQIIKFLENGKKSRKVFFIEGINKNNGDYIIYINNSNTYKSIDMKNSDFKILNQIYKLYKELYKYKIIIDFQKISQDFHVDNGKIFYKYNKNLSDVLKVYEDVDNNFLQEYYEIEKKINYHYKLLVLLSPLTELNDLKINDYNENSGKYRGMKVKIVEVMVSEERVKMPELLVLEETFKISEERNMGLKEIYQESTDKNLDCSENNSNEKFLSKVTSDRLMLNTKYFSNSINRHIGYTEPGKILIEDYGPKFSSILVEKSIENRYEPNDKYLKKPKKKIEQIHTNIKSIKTYKISIYEEASYLKLRPIIQPDLIKWSISIKFDILSRFEEVQLTKKKHAKNYKKVEAKKTRRIPKWMTSRACMVSQALNDNRYTKITKKNLPDHFFSFIRELYAVKFESYLRELCADIDERISEPLKKLESLKSLGIAENFFEIFLNKYSYEKAEMFFKIFLKNNLKRGNYFEIRPNLLPLDKLISINLDGKKLAVDFYGEIFEKIKKSKVF